MYQPQKKFHLFKKKKRYEPSGSYIFSSSDDLRKDKTSHYTNQEKKKRRTRKVLYVILAGFLFVASVFAWYSKDLPNPYKINKRHIAQSTKILDRTGKLLYEIHGEENRTLIQPKEIPENVKKATIAIEDRDFYKHKGFNFKGIMRAFVYDVLQRDMRQGGSTITQQFVKNALLTSETSITRKIKELILSIEIENIYSKEEILTMYLNEIPYGNNSYGIQAASKTYFDKDAKDLSLSEAATLAAIVQAPTYYNPYGSNTDVLMKRKDYVIDTMKEMKLISQDDADKAKKEDIKFIQKNQGILAPHFVMYVKEFLAEKYGEEKLREGGMTVTTSLDYEKQKIAEEVIAKQKDYMKSKGTGNASLVSIDPKTGEILAMVGSTDYFDTENDGNVNVSVRLRQPGSSLKPLIYAAAFEKGYAPSTMLMDVETDFGNGYKPQNYDGRFRGPVSIRKSLGNSLNIPAVKALQLVGVKTATDLAQKMGIASLNDPERYGLSLVLGGGEVKLTELVTAYGSLANGGIKHDLHPILKIQDETGKVIEEYKKDEDKGERVLDENVAYLVTNVLSDDSARAETFGMGGILTLSGRPVAAKTGTTDQYRDAWTTGYTPSVVTGVWAGNNDNSPMDHAAGSMIAAPIWNEYMKRVLANTDVEQFKQTSGTIYSSVDALTGMLPIDTSLLSEEEKKKMPTKQEIFWNKYPPSKTDNVHKIVRLIKGENKVANKDCPEGMTEYKVFLEFNSILPENTSWQGAVLSWAQANGYNNIPKEEASCQDLKDKNQPTAKIDSLEQSQNSINIIASYQAPKEIEKIEYFINEEKVAEKSSITSSPVATSIDISKLSPGNITVKIKVTDKIGLTATDQKSISISKTN